VLINVVNAPSETSVRPAALSLAPVFVDVDTTGLSAGAAASWSYVAGQPKAVDMVGARDLGTARTHKSITRPGSPPRGRHR
jgi:hypothetical protein